MNQLFSADATMYRNSNFSFFLPMKIWRKLPSKVRKFSKIEEIFPSSLTPQNFKLIQVFLNLRCEKNPCKAKTE